jgi:hypothetical protein
MNAQAPDMIFDKKPAIFMHIQKTAGTSIVEMVREHYEPTQVISHGEYLERLDYSPLARNGKLDERTVVTSFQDVRFLSGHFGYDFASLFMQERYSFTFLRDPIERVLSFYYFCKNRDPNEFEIYRTCQQLSLDEFLKMGLRESDVNSFIWNNQVWQLACGFNSLENRDFSSFEADELLDLSIKHLDDFSYVGLAETFEEDRDKILVDLGIPPPKKKITLNTNPGRPTSKDLSRSTMKLLEQLTELDRILYEIASSRRSRFMKVTKFMNASHVPQQVNNVHQTNSVGPIEVQNELQRIRDIYLELMQSSLTGNIYRDAPRAPFGPKTFVPKLREHGLDWPSHAQTMIGIKRLANLRALTESVITDNVPGDLIETGVWRGGACILMRAVLYAYGITDRYVWAADSFEGLPSADEARYPADAGSTFHKYSELAVSLQQVQENFKAYDLLDEQTKFIKGWFRDTLPIAPIGQLALMRLDGDMYESTMDALTNLYPKLSPHGYVIVDDYHVVPACRRAVDDYCDANELNPDIIEIDGVGVYWRKPSIVSGEYQEFNPLNQSALSSDLQIARLNRAVAELSQSIIKRLGQILIEYEQTVAEREQIIAAQERTIVECKHAILEREKQIKQLNQFVVERDEHLAELNEKVAALLSSTSWRITKPIRAAKNIINTLDSTKLTARK